jgi:hypothetical protein
MSNTQAKPEEEQISDQSACTVHAAISDRVTKEVEIRKISN